MKRKRIEFTMEHTLIRRVVRNLRIVKETVDTVQIQVVGYMDPNTSLLPSTEGMLVGDEPKFSCDIEHIWWEGRDIYPILESVSALEPFEAAAERETVSRFMSQKAA